ncbi:MAG: hypothetical protein R3F14_07765 [Polyangiaceae bacterium]
MSSSLPPRLRRDYHLARSLQVHWIENLSIVALVMMSLAVWSGLEERRRWAVLRSSSLPAPSLSPSGSSAPTR